MTARFEDTRLELVAREALDAARLPEDAWAELRTLHAARRGIRRLGGVEQLTGLRWLDLDANPIVSLEPLATVTQLRGLRLRKTRVASLQALTGLSALEHLDLRDAGLQSIAGLVGASALRSLDLTDCLVTDLEPLRGFPKLRSFVVGYRSLAADSRFGLEPILAAVSLRELVLRRVSLPSMSALDGLVQLEALSLPECSFEDRLSEVPALPRLRYLNLVGAKIDDVAGLAGLPRLEVLDLSDTKVEDLAPLRALRRLRVLVLDETELRSRDVEVLRDMPHLAEIRLPGPSVGRYMSF